MQEQRRDIGRASRVPPLDVRLGDVTRTTHGQIRAAGIATCGVEDAPTVHRHPNGQLDRPSGAPQTCTRARVERVNPSARVDDQFVPSVVRDDDRRAIRAAGSPAVNAPSLAAGLGVQGQQVSIRWMVTLKDDQIFIQRRRAAVPPEEIERLVVATDVTCPQQLTVKIERDQWACTEPGEHRVPVGHDARCCPAMVSMNRGQGCLRSKLVGPDRFAVLEVQCLNHE